MCAARSVHAEIERLLVDACARPVLRFYDVKDLVAKIRAAPEQEIELGPSSYRPPTVEPAIEVDQLIECIRATVEPRSWDTVEDALATAWPTSFIQSKNNVLVVLTTPEVHGRIARYLGDLGGGARSPKERGLGDREIHFSGVEGRALLERLERGK